MILIHNDKTQLAADRFFGYGLKNQCLRSHYKNPVNNLLNFFQRAWMLHCTQILIACDKHKIQIDFLD